jgi:hypothetical protein
MYGSFDLLGARDLAMEACRNCNNWLAKQEPWKMKDDKASYVVTLNISKHKKMRVIIYCY